MSLLDEESTVVNYVNVVEVETEFSNTTNFKGVSNTFSSYPVINVVDNENPTQPYQVTSKKYVDENFQSKSSYLDGISSSVQNQLDSKLSTSTASSTYQPIITNSSYIDMTSSIQNQLDSKLSTSTASSTYQPIITNASYIDMTSSIQSQLDSKLSTSTASSTYQPLLTNPQFYDPTSSIQTQINSKTTESFVSSSITTAINNLINSAPGTMDTLGEISTILSTNVNDIGTLTTSIAGKLSKSGNDTASGIITFSQPPVMSGVSISAGTIPDNALSSTFLTTSSASSTYQTQSATTSSLALKANLNSPTFTGTVSGITKSMIGLSNVDNVSDTNKPVSSAQQTAIDDVKSIMVSNNTTGIINGSSIVASDQAYAIGNSSGTVSNSNGGTINISVGGVLATLVQGQTLRVSSLISPAVILDGIASAWTVRPNTFYLSALNGVAYGNVGGTNYYVIVGVGGLLATSTDLITWTSRTSGFGSTIINHVCYGNISGTGYFVAVGASGKLSVSTDAITWTTKTSGFGSTAINSVCFGNNLFVAVGASGVMTTSTDTNTWTTRTSGFSTTAINSVAYGVISSTDWYVAVGASGVLTTSNDGTTWTSRTSSFDTASINSVAFGNGLFIIGGQSGLLASSSNATTYTQRTNATGNVAINSISYGVIGSTHVYIAIGTASTNIQYSNDGINWVRRASVTNSSTNEIGFGNGTFIIVGAAGYVISSSNMVECLLTPITYQAL